MPQISVKISLQPIELIMVKKSLARLDQSGQDLRSGFANNHVACDLLRAMILSVDVDSLDAEGPGYRIKDSYDSLLRISFGARLLSFIHLYCYSQLYSFSYFQPVYHVDHFVGILKEAQQDSKDVRPEFPRLKLWPMRP